MFSLIVTKLSQSKMMHLIILFTVLICISACKNEKKIDEIPSTDNSMGVVPLPLNFDNSSLKDGYDLARYCGTYISLAEELGWTNNKNILAYQNDVEYANNRELGIIISMDLLTDDRKQIRNLPSGWELKNFSDEILQKSFIDEAYSITSLYQPDYFFLSLEINGYAAENYSDFLDFTTLYSSVYDRIKIDFPNIKIGVTFNYEKMLCENQWSIIATFNDKLDCFGFTTYPQILYPVLDDIPDNYYSSTLKNLGSTEIIFTEIGWQGKQDKSDEVQQQEFIEKYFQLIESCNVTISIWSLLHDWDGGGFFETMGLIDIEGRKKAAWEKWYEYSHSR